MNENVAEELQKKVGEKTTAQFNAFIDKMQARVGSFAEEDEKYCEKFKECCNESLQRILMQVSELIAKMADDHGLSYHELMREFAEVMYDMNATAEEYTEIGKNFSEETVGLA